MASILSSLFFVLLPTAIHSVPILTGDSSMTAILKCELCIIFTCAHNNMQSLMEKITLKQNSVEPKFLKLRKGDYS